MWNLEKREHKHYERNPIKLVVAQIRFHRILKVADKIADIQDLLRQDFPEFGEQMTRAVNMREPTALEVREEAQFLFSKEDVPTRVILSSDSLSLESQVHEHHEIFFQDFKGALEALNSIYAPVVPTRLGLRYINLIKRSEIDSELSRPVVWSDLVDSRFLRLPETVVDERDTYFANEVTSILDKGMLTLRYGLVREPQNKAEVFKFDVDRYFDGRFSIENTMSLLSDFVDNVYCLFDEMAQPGLREWMKPKED